MTSPLRYTYIVGLSAGVWNIETFRARNRRTAARHDRGEDVEAVYVGSGTHRAPCRFEIYRGSRICTCGFEPQGDVRHGMASPWVERFGVSLLAETAVEGLGSAAAVRAARGLASRLRRQGFGVWQVP